MRMFAIWLVMVDPCFIFHDDSFQAVVTFRTTAIYKLFADVQMFLFMQFCELLWDPSYTNLLEGKADADNFIG